ncbi:hypothetical protein INS49_009547 [Diaporthe citri]|uniref:uncharacterized protein n=1 Tax=Diaporthe citri TaxID=83186 RepID=UPI001C7F5310|nr:uncharacterized protein INS49_009547 [Diaporthe citri]KAG6361322.1 hypothetical protein INS49_009547 [Diaporthe citri]
MAPLEILIVGCSIAGPALATFLLLSPLPASQKPHITIVERSPALRIDGQNIDIRGSGVTLIRHLGLEGAVRASTTGEEGVQLVDSDNTVWSQFGADKTGRYQTPTSDIEILRGRLSELLWKRSKDVSDEIERDGGKGVEHLFGDYLDEIEQIGDKVKVHFAKSGQRRSFDLVIGADGLQSRTRSTVWGSDGEEDRVRKLGMYAAFFSMPRGRTDSQWRRWFHAPGRRGIMVRPDEQRDKTTVFMHVINNQDERLPSLAGKRDAVQAQKDIMAEYFLDAGWESERIIKEMMATKDFYYDMVGQVKMDKWSKGRVVLVGDAGYCASPLSGMGTTLALNGAYNLAGAILQHPGDLTAAFAQYETIMRPLVDRAQKLAPGMPRLANPETARGISVLLWIGYLFSISKLHVLLFALGLGPPANAVPVEDYGLRKLQEVV